MILVCLISRQTMQNLLPILQYRPQRVVFLSTKEEDDSRKNLEPILRAHQIPYDAPLYVDAYAPDSTAQECQHVVDRYGAANLMANVTGGTKVMSLAAFRVFSAVDIPCLYTDTEHKRLLFLHPDKRETEPLDTRVGVLTYLQAHGQAAHTRGPDSRFSSPQLAVFIGQHISEIDPFLSRLRYEIHAAPHQLIFRFSLDGQQRNAAAAELLQRATHAGVLDAQRHGAHELEVHFRSEKARRYLDGDWLEDLVFDAVQKAGFESCATNIALPWRDNQQKEMNEIDVAVVHNLRFFYLSCKTRSDPAEIKNHLYELNTLSKLAGGLFNNPILVASSPKAAPGYIRRRMEMLGIAYVGPGDLPHLSTKLQKIIK
jgi:hypothetical protein